MINLIQYLKRHCPVCGEKTLVIFFELKNVPVHCNLLWKTRDAALNCPKGDIKLAFCNNCTYIFNLEFQPALLEYSQSYDSSLHFSPYFKGYASLLAASLIEKYDLYDKDIIEIGSGKGYFLSLLCKLGNNRGIGFDPSFSGQQRIDKITQIKFIQDYYSEKYNNYQADLIVSRHVLEHIPDPKNFLKIIRRVIGEHTQTRLYFEVPNALKTIRRLFIWDIIYEHYSYFTSISLRHLFSICGLDINKISENYEGQFLGIEAEPNMQKKSFFLSNQKNGVKKISDNIASFFKKYQHRIEKCKQKLNEIENKKQRVVLWGAGSKGVTFLNAFKNSQIKYAVDINPNKQGMYIPGTGQIIVQPKFLQEYKPNVIIIMNPIYKNEIKKITLELGINSNFVFA